MSFLLSPIRRLRQFSGSDQVSSEFWALRDVTFEVQPGEVLGIIGRNGAGKSTLLKILSQIVEPTRGEVILRGRVASLLEVGTGFHPDLTGRENIFLNGSILGMKKREIVNRFDEIVAFAEIDRFLDTPVKRYSSGMYVRLAFAVAAHLEPEILIVDEVLAVGDAEFQKKCLGKMKEVSSGSGRTVIFVSHNMAAVENLCSKAALIDHGTLTRIGDVKQVVVDYLSRTSLQSTATTELLDHPFRRIGAQPLLTRIELNDAEGKGKTCFSTGEPMSIKLTISTQTAIRSLQFGIGVDSQYGARIFSVATYLSDCQLEMPPGESSVRCTIESLPLVPGHYYLSLSAGPSSQLLLDQIEEAISFEVMGGDFYGNGKPTEAWSGVVAVRSQWLQE
jgi:lipopolysaccharide transport system ATP-binding protein